MSFIQVPIGKGITKFSNGQNILQRQASKIRLETNQSNSDFQFLEDLIENGNYVFEQATRADIGEILNITPSSGTTFYCLAASVFNSSAATSSTINLNDTNITQQTKNSTGMSTITFDIPIIRIVGNGVNKIHLNMNSAVTNLTAFIAGYTRNTEKQ